MARNFLAQRDYLCCENSLKSRIRGFPTIYLNLIMIFEFSVKKKCDLDSNHQLKPRWLNYLPKLTKIVVNSFSVDSNGFFEFLFLKFNSCF